MNDSIEKAVQYIEDNLKNKITLGDIAEAAGYSPYHFMRLFRNAVGLTPGDYIRKRRLSEIAREMEESAEPAGGLAYTYGFQSKENFTRAFYREHKVLPTEYRTARNSLKLYGRFMFQKPAISVEPEILSLESLSLTGYYSNETGAPKFWNRYNCGNLSKKLSGGKVCEDFGVCIWNSAQKKLDYFIGIRSKEALGDLAGTDTLRVPRGEYAVLRRRLPHRTGL